MEPHCGPSPSHNKKEEKIFGRSSLRGELEKVTQYGIAFSSASDSSAKHSARRVGLSHLTRNTAQDCLVCSLTLLLGTQFLGDSHDLFKAEGILELPRNPKSPVVVSGINLSVVFPT